MKNFICVLAVLFAFNFIYAQSCSDGSNPESVVLNLTGLNSAGALGSSGNSSGTICFPGASIMDVVGIEWSGIDVEPVGGSWCNEAAIDFEGALALTPAVGEGNQGPCDNNYSSGGILDLNELGLVFGTDVNGCITWEAFETFDDDDEATPDQTFGDGTITLWGCPPGAILPVHLVSFEVKAHEYANMIHWSTAIEINSQRMVLEKSKNLQSWSEVGSVSSRGSSHSGAIYSIEDDSPYRLSYYRLRMIDFDGSYEYSHIISIQREITAFKVNRIGPNPTVDNLIISVESSEEQVVNVDLYDVSGKLVMSQIKAIESGISSFNLDLARINKGLYICQLRAGSQISTHQIIKGE